MLNFINFVFFTELSLRVTGWEEWQQLFKHFFGSVSSQFFYSLSVLLLKSGSPLKTFSRASYVLPIMRKKQWVNLSIKALNPRISDRMWPFKESGKYEKWHDHMIIFGVRASVWMIWPRGDLRQQSSISYAASRRILTRRVASKDYCILGRNGRFTSRNETNLGFRPSQLCRTLERERD